MSTTRAHAIALVDEFLARTGMAAWALGHVATGNAKAVGLLRAGRVHLRTIEKLEDWIAAHPEGAPVPRPGRRTATATA